jgi:hypothetical protein
MPAVPPIAEPASDLLLTAGELGTLLGLCSYRGAMIATWRWHVLPVGCRVSLQFGDQLARDNDGLTQLVIRCSLELNGRDARIGEVTYWHVRKVLSAMVNGERVQFALRTTTCHVGIGLAACDCLTDQVLPDLAQAVRAMIAQERSAGSPGTAQWPSEALPASAAAF